MHKVLVPFDGSDSALRAVEHAISLARTNGPYDIHVVTAYEEPVMYGEIAVYVSPEKMEALQRERCEVIIAVAEDLLRKAGVSYTKEILVGHIPEVIARRATELGCDGIIMGTRGHTAIGNLILGSVATKVIHLATVPVTLIK